MRTMTFTDAELQAASRGRDVQRDFQDVVERALYLRVGARRKTFFTTGRVRGVRQFITLGEFPGVSIEAARKAASKQKRAWQAQREGQQPTTAVLPSVPTLAACVERHIADSNDLRRRKGKRELVSAELMRSSLKHHFSKQWDEPVTEITAQLIATKYRGIPGRVLACLRAALRIPVRNHTIPDPLIELPRGTVGASGETALITELRKDPSRLKDLLQAIRSYKGSPDLRVFAEMLLFTGRRPGELRTLRWNDIELERQVYAVREHKTSSNADDFIYAPLTPHLVQLLQRWQQFRALNPRGDDRDLYVFPACQVGTADPFLSVKGYRGIARHIQTKCKFKAFTIYQLRKMFVSVCENINMAPNTAHLLTGHKIEGARGHYSFSMAEMLRPQLEAVGAKLRELAAS